jgi:hypothetical protein
MNAGDNRDQERLRMQAAHAVTLSYLREGWEIARRSNNHEDTTLVWLIALSGGAILLAFQIPVRFVPDSPWWLILAVAPWVIAVLIGVRAKILMAELLLADDVASHRSTWDLAHLPFVEDPASAAFKQRLLAILERRTPSGDTEPSQIELNALSKKVTSWSHACALAFGIGVVWFVAVVVCGLLSF